MAVTGTLFDQLGTSENDRRQRSRARSIDNLSQLGGMASQPQSPFAAGTAGLGITSDQAKMAGSRAQLNALPDLAPAKVDSATSAAQGALPEQKQVLEATRAQAATAPDQAAQELKTFASEWEAQVGGFAHRVVPAGMAAVTGAAGQAGTGAVVVSDQELTLLGLKPDEIKPLVAAYNAATTDAARFKALEDLHAKAGSAGLAGIFRTTTGGGADAYAAYVAKAMPDELTLDMLNTASKKARDDLAKAETALAANPTDAALIAARDAAQARVTATPDVLDVPKVAALLGIDATKLTGMNVGQIRKAIKDKLTASFSTTDNLKAQLNDANLSATDRADIRQKLRDAGETGVAATEAEMRDLQKSIAKAGIITLPNGETIAFEDLLKDTEVQKLVLEYINDPTKAADMPPELKTWVDANRALVDAAFNTVLDRDTNWQKFKATQKETTTLFAGHEGVLENLRTTMGLPASGPVYDQAQWDSFMSSPLVALIGSTNATGTEGKAKATAMMTHLSEAQALGFDLMTKTTGPDGKVTYSLKYTPEQLSSMGFDDTKTNPVKFKQSLAYIQKAETGDPDSVWSFLLTDPLTGKPYTGANGAPLTAGDIATDNLQATAANKWLGDSVAPRPELLRILDSNADGVVSKDEMAAVARDPKLVGQLANLGPTAYTDIHNNLATVLQNSGPLGGRIAAGLADGAMDDAEFSKILDDTVLHAEDLMKLKGSPIWTPQKMKLIEDAALNRPSWKSEQRIELTPVYKAKDEYEKAAAAYKNFHVPDRPTVLDIGGDLWNKYKAKKEQSDKLKELYKQARKKYDEEYATALKKVPAVTAYYTELGTILDSTRLKDMATGINRNMDELRL